MSKLALKICVLAAAFTLGACSDDPPEGNNGSTAGDTGADVSDDVQPDVSEPDMGPPPDAAKEDTSVVSGPERRAVAFSVFPPVPSDCNTPGARQRVPFVYQSTEVIPVVTGDVVNGDVVEPNVTLDIGSLAVRRARVSTAEVVDCTSDAECGGGFHCAASGLPGAMKRCTRQTGVEFIPGSVAQDYDPATKEDSQQLVGMLIENTALLEGRLPVDSGGLFDATDSKDLFQDLARATDPTRIHRQAIKDFLVGLASVADPMKTQVTVWWYAGQLAAEARPLVAPMELTNHFTRDLSIGEALVDGMPNPVPKPANLFQGILAMIEKDFGLPEYADHEKFIYVFADGPNEVYDESARYAEVLDALESHNIHLVIVHLDTQIDSTLMRDLPTYWAGNRTCQEDAACAGAPTCDSGADCQNFEECRPALQYGVNMGDPVVPTTVSYCMPRYVDGRLGPIDQFADLACRTGGNYLYVVEPEQMRQHFRALPAQVDGQFSIEADFSALASTDVGVGFYRLSGVFIGLLDVSDLAALLSAPVTGFVTTDNRPLIRLGRVKN